MLCILHIHNHKEDLVLVHAILELRAQGLDLPYGCEYGGCITCAAKLIKGEIDQRSQVALNNRQINDGYVVLCVAKPKTDCEIEIGVESHDKLYRNPFLDPLAPHELKAFNSCGASGSRKGFR